MHHHSIQRWRHEHVFLGERHQGHERRTWLVVALTVVTMVAEIIGGTLFGSVALVADGWHMSTHAAALAIAALAYRFARTYAHDPRFSFGTGKLGEVLRARQSWSWSRFSSRTRALPASLARWRSASCRRSRSR